MSEQYRPGKAWSVTVLLSFFMLVNFLDKIAIGLVAVPLMEEFKLTASEFGILASSFFWLFSLSCMAGGFLANRFDAKWLLLGMALIWSLAQLPIIYASSMVAIIAARVVLGVGEGPASPVAVHACYKWFPNDRRNLPVTVILMGATVGLLVAGLTIPVITAAWGWRANFTLLGALGAVWALLWLAFGAEGSIDDATAAEGATANAKKQIPYLTLLTDRTIVSCIILHFVAYWALALTLTWLPAYMQKGLGFDGVTSGRLFGLVVIIAIPINVAGSWWSQRLLTKGVSSRVGRGVISSLAMAIAGILFLCLSAPGIGAIQKVLVIAVAAALPPIVYSLAPGIIGEVAPPSQRGAMLAIDNAVATLAAILAPAVTGFLIEHFGGSNPAFGYELGFALNGVLLVIGAIVGLVWTNPEKSVEQLHGVDAQLAVAGR